MPLSTYVGTCSALEKKRRRPEWRFRDPYAACMRELLTICALTFCKIGAVRFYEFRQLIKKKKKKHIVVLLLSATGAVQN